MAENEEGNGLKRLKLTADPHIERKVYFVKPTGEEEHERFDS